MIKSAVSPAQMDAAGSSAAASKRENMITIAILGTVASIYIYLLVSPSQPHLLARPRNFVLHRDTLEAYKLFYENFKKDQYPSYESWGQSGNFSSTDLSYGEWGTKGEKDDFFMNDYKDDTFRNSSDSRGEVAEVPHGPNVPSDQYRCGEGWLSIRAEINYKYLWMHTGENEWMGATATMDTPLHRRSYEMLPVNKTCEGGWLRLREADSPGFLMMVPPTTSFEIDEWVVKVGSSLLNETESDERYHFLLEEEGYLLNKGSMAFVNILPEAEYGVRGHTSNWDRTKAADRQYGTKMHFSFVNGSLVEEAIKKEEAEIKESIADDKSEIAMIAKFPTSTEKRVISFGLYGAKEKYTIGAIRNAELWKTYFPGWVCRYYVTSDVPKDVLDTLTKLGAELETVPAGMGYSSGMFWRFMVASDPTVDRFIVRDVDSRLNGRDRIAVEAWIDSKVPVHILRDHVNHCIPMNGGMWGAVKGAIPSMDEKVKAWSSRDEYMADLHFLEQRVWPEVKNKQISHDSYCCDRFPNTKPYPTRRNKVYQHVGQVFDSHDRPRLMDIDGLIRGVPIPGSCRKQPDWIYG